MQNWLFALSRKTMGGALAQMFAPPAHPTAYVARLGSVPAGISCLLGGIFFAMITLPFCAFLIELPFFLSGLGVAGCGIIALCLALASARQRAIAVSRVPQWEWLMSKWDRLFYCSCCAHVYHPQSGRHAKSDNIASLLYNQ